MLENLTSGLSTKGLIEQSNCFVFYKGHVVTYNGEIACRCEHDLPIRGAVPAEPLLAIINSMPDDKFVVSCSDQELELKVVSPNPKKAPRKIAKIVLAKEVLLPFKDVASPTTWSKLNEAWVSAAKSIALCVSTDESDATFTSVHLHPNHIEASDNYQIARSDIKTRIKQPSLVRGVNLRKVLALEPSEIALSRSWVHFRNGMGTEALVRRDVSPYPDLSQWLNIEGEKAVLPKLVKAAANSASVFSNVTGEANLVQVTLQDKVMILRGHGPMGSYEQRIAGVSYQGPRITFQINPDLLNRLLEHDTECIVSDTKLKVTRDNYTYISCTKKTQE
jgi:hypothetical protein